jgi:hypothetical protein
MQNFRTQKVDRERQSSGSEQFVVDGLQDFL